MLFLPVRLAAYSARSARSSAASSASPARHAVTPAEALKTASDKIARVIK